MFASQQILIAKNPKLTCVRYFGRASHFKFGEFFVEFDGIGCRVKWNDPNALLFKNVQFRRFRIEHPTVTIELPDDAAGFDVPQASRRCDISRT